MVDRGGDGLRRGRRLASDKSERVDRELKIRITPSMSEALGEASRRHGISVSALVREAVVAWLEEQE